MDQQAETEPGQKKVRRRNQNACDGCRARKIKCLYDGPTCRACIELGVICTQNRPRKRRGPPNSYAVAVRAENHLSPTTASSSTSSSSPAQSSSDVLGQIACSSIIRTIVDDWFQFLHPVSPTLHRGHFLQRLENGDASHDPEFCGLVISICAAAVASLKRKASMKYSSVTVDRCCEVIEQNRLLERKRSFTVEWCQAKYNIAVTRFSEQGFDDVAGFQYMVDAVMGVKYLLYYALPKMNFLSQQLLKRLFWLIFAGQSSAEIFGRPCVGILSPMDDIDSLYPLDITDDELDPEFRYPDPCWQADKITYIPGLNYLSNLFLIWNSSQQHSSDSIAHLQDHIHRIRRALDNLPAELRWRGGLSRPPRSNFGTDVQIANLYITQLHIRSNLLEQSYRLVKAQNQELTSQQIISERQSIVDDMLEILHHMPRETLEANGHSLLPKVRDIGSALLDEIRMGEGSGIVSGKAEGDLLRLLGRLEKLDYRPEFEEGRIEGLMDIRAMAS